MATAGILFEAIVLFLFLSSTAFLLLLAFVRPGHRLEVKDIETLVKAKLPDVRKGKVGPLVTVPPEWLRVPTMLTGDVARTLESAGRPYEATPQEFVNWFGLRMGAYTFLAVAAYVSVTTMMLLRADLGDALKMGLLILLSIVVLGVWPLVSLRSDLRRAAERRQQRIRQQLPYAVDMLVMLLDAGTDLGGALEAFEAFGPEGPLRDEMRLMLQELRAGASKDDVITDLARRNPIPEVERLSLVVREGQRMGTPLVDTLRGQADVLRTERLQRATATAERMTHDARIWLVLIVGAITLLFVGPFLLSMQSGLRTVRGGG